FDQRLDSRLAHGSTHWANRPFRLTLHRARLLQERTTLVSGSASADLVNEGLPNRDVSASSASRSKARPDSGLPVQKASGERHVAYRRVERAMRAFLCRAAGDRVFEMD